jgi:hypothetical protein
MSICQDVNMSGCQYVNMSICQDVRMSICQDVKSLSILTGTMSQQVTAKIPTCLMLTFGHLNILTF